MSAALHPPPPTPRQQLERAITIRYRSDHVEMEITRVIRLFGLVDTGYDPTWIERRRAERAARAAKAATL